MMAEQSVPKSNRVELPNCPVKSVVVYPDRAEVTRAVKLTLESGDHDIVFDKISKAIDKLVDWSRVTRGVTPKEGEEGCVCYLADDCNFNRDSVRIDGSGSATIVEVSFREIPVTQEQDNQNELKVK